MAPCPLGMLIVQRGNGALYGGNGTQCPAMASAPLGNCTAPLGNGPSCMVEMPLCPLEMESAFATECGNKEKRSEDRLEVVAELPVRPPSLLPHEVHHRKLVIEKVSGYTTHTRVITTHYGNVG